MYQKQKLLDVIRRRFKGRRYKLAQLSTIRQKLKQLVVFLCRFEGWRRMIKGLSTMWQKQKGLAMILKILTRIYLIENKIVIVKSVFRVIERKGGKYWRKSGLSY